MHSELACAHSACLLNTHANVCHVEYNGNALCTHMHSFMLLHSYTLFDMPCIVRESEAFDLARLHRWLFGIKEQDYTVPSDLHKI